MPRSYCSSCHRPMLACICKFTVSIANTVDVIVLQHPSEVKQSKGTVTLLTRSLNNCTVFVGEDFANNAELINHLKQFSPNIAVLYPSEQALVLEDVILPKNDKFAFKQCLIILDGTWKKAYRLYMLNSFLHQLPHWKLPLGIEGKYEIRKTHKTNALSSLEACCYALSMLENAPEKYQPLMDNFVKFNQFQQSFTAFTAEVTCKIE